MVANQNLTNLVEMILLIGLIMKKKKSTKTKNGHLTYPNIPNKMGIDLVSTTA